MPSARSDRLDAIALALIRARIGLTRVRRAPPAIIARLDAVIVEAEALKQNARGS